jgi:O-antigen chain-terminating methyltransferase
VAGCSERNLDVIEADLFAHLASRPPESLGGAFCAQVVEHLPGDAVVRMLELLAPAMTSNAVAVVETPNPASFAVHVHSFWRDPTHLRPVPPPLVWFAARRAGFVVESTVYSAPVPDEDRLAGVDVEPDSVDLRLMVKRYNETIGVLNDLLFGPQNYAVVLRKPDA